MSSTEPAMFSLPHLYSLPVTRVILRTPPDRCSKLHAACLSVLVQVITGLAGDALHWYNIANSSSRLKKSSKSFSDDFNEKKKFEMMK